MTVSKRVRYEVLRRDNHACRYCGAVAPDVKLHVDHVIPVALGGTDTPDNLAASCAACNSGKTSTPADAEVVDDVKQRALNFKRGYDAALQAQVIKIRASKQYREWFINHWAEHAGDRVMNGWEATLDHWHSLDVPWEVVENAIDIASSRPNLRTTEAVYKYMCGIVWNVIKAAAEEYADPTNPAEDKPRICDLCWQESDALIDKWGSDGEVIWSCFECVEVIAGDRGRRQGRNQMIGEIVNQGGVYQPMDLISALVDGIDSDARDELEWKAE